MCRINVVYVCIRNMIKTIKTTFYNLKLFRWGLFASLCLLAFVPAIFTTIRTFLISTEANTSAIDIVGQMEWFDLIDETIKAFLIVPLYSILNKIFKTQKGFAESTFKTFITVFIIYSLFSLIIYIYGEVLVGYMNNKEVDINVIGAYLRIETIAFAVGIIQSFVNVVFVVVGKSKNMYIFLLVKCVLLVICDFLLIPNFGVQGVAYSNILTNAMLGIAGITILIVEKYIRFAWFDKQDIKIFGNWFKVGIFSGGQQFLDNIIYALMVVKMVNLVAEQGNYWVANNFIWGWLLIPISALSEVIKSDCKNDYKNLKQTNYYLIVLFTVILWSIFIPAYTPFLSEVEKLENADEIFLIIMKLFVFYIAYALSQITSSIFIGTGKTKYNIVSSIIVNLVYYGIFFILVQSKIISMTMDMIIVMFGCGMVVSFIINLIEERIFLKKELNLVEKQN